MLNVYPDWMLEHTWKEATHGTPYICVSSKYQLLALNLSNISERKIFKNTEVKVNIIRR